MVRIYSNKTTNWNLGAIKERVKKSAAKGGKGEKGLIHEAAMRALKIAEKKRVNK